MDLVIEQKDGIRQHIYDRPDTYIGSVIPESRSEWIVNDIDNANTHFIYKEIKIIDGIIQLFNEIRSNAIDNVWRSKEIGISCREIKFKITKKKISVWNDGRTIPIETQINKRTNEPIYKPELVFAEFWTSTNYNDDEKRKTCGKNGYGAKLTNTFSKSFIIETYDKERGLHYKQKWKDNLKIRKDPKIEETKDYDPFTKVTYKLDFKRFGVKEYDKDTLAYLYRLCYDTAMTTGLNVYLNGSLLKSSTLLEYVMLFRTEPTKEFLRFDTNDSKVILTTKETDTNNLMGFTNGVWNREGGVHIDTWSKELYSHIVDTFSKKRKKKEDETKKKKTKKEQKEEEKKKAQKEEIKLTPADIKSLFSIYVVSEFDNPTYSSQAKEKLKAPKPEIKLSEKELKSIKKVRKWNISKDIDAILEMKKKKELEKLNPKKTFHNVAKLQDANLAGTKRSREASLIITEGDSAATYAKIGIEEGVFGKKGTDYFGIFPITGKTLNVRKANIKSIKANKIVQNIILALGLTLNVDYTDEKNFDTLKYGKLIILADADIDGTHIRGLIINFIETLYPSLCKRGDFIVDMKTPLYRIKKGNKMKEFYTDHAYREYLNNHIVHEDDIQYFKGLGGTNDGDILSSFGKKIVLFDYDNNAHDSLELAFSDAKKGSERRKKWLLEYIPENCKELVSEKGSEHRVSYTDFINHELIKFSMEDNVRSIPSIMDGYKPSQRKLIHTGLKKKIFKLKKADAYASVTGEITMYHHGAKNLEETIIGMAQTFPNSNNYTFISCKGQPGSRLQGGKDAASGRYIELCLDKKILKFFRNDEYLEYLNEDGKQIEPKYFLPPVPIVLFNTSKGIGTGYSTDIPCYNPKEVVDATKKWIYCKKNNLPFNMEDLVPYYNEFIGTIERNAKGKNFITKGIYEKVPYKSGYEITITELPIGTWTNDYHEYLKDLKEQKKIKKIINKTKGKNIIKFIIHVDNDFNDKLLGLESKISVSNFVLFDAKEQLRKYKNTIEIIEDFCESRLVFYIKKKENILNDLKIEENKIGEKIRFLKQVINEEIKVFQDKKGKKKSEIISQIEENKYVKFGDSYNYLFKIPIYKLTEEELEKLHKDLEKTKENIQKQSDTKPEEVWLSEIEELEKEL